MPDEVTLARWLEQADLLEDMDTLPTTAEYRLALELREAVARACGALANDASPAASDLETINRIARKVTLGAPYLDPTAMVQRWRTGAPVQLALGRLAVGAIRVISQEGDRLVRCQLPGCGALLLSGRRGEPRRWCSMQTCGNRAKVRAFRAQRDSAPV